MKVDCLSAAGARQGGCCAVLEGNHSSTSHLCKHAVLFCSSLYAIIIVVQWIY